MFNVHKKHVYLFALVLMVTVFAAQKDAQNIYDGNKLYYSGNLPGAQSKYARALEANPNNRKANFNLGNSLYRNAQLIKSGQLQLPPDRNMTPDSLSRLVLDQAAQNFAVVANSVSNKDTLHRAWHNIGNCYLQKKDYQQAVEAYKKSLKFDPKDEETRYNLAYALKNLPKENKKGGGGQKPQPQNQKEDKNEKDKNPQPQDSKMSKEQAEQLLKALMDQERKLQDRRKQKPEDANKQVDKDW